MQAKFPKCQLGGDENGSKKKCHGKDKNGEKFSFDLGTAGARKITRGRKVGISDNRRRRPVHGDNNAREDWGFNSNATSLAGRTEGMSTRTNYTIIDKESAAKSASTNAEANRSGEKTNVATLYELE